MSTKAIGQKPGQAAVHTVEAAAASNAKANQVPGELLRLYLRGQLAQSWVQRLSGAERHLGLRA